MCVVSGVCVCGVWHSLLTFFAGPALANSHTYFTYFTFGHVSDFAGSALRLIGRSR